MAVKLRLKRMGRKKAPFYRIVAADSRMPRDGRFIEQLGTYDPSKSPAAVTLKKEEILRWLSNLLNLRRRLKLWITLKLYRIFVLS